MIRSTLAIFTIGAVAAWMAAVAAWSIATYAARVTEEDEIDTFYTDIESDEE